jgi:hypothetical protein
VQIPEGLTSLTLGCHHLSLGDLANQATPPSRPNLRRTATILRQPQSNTARAQLLPATSCRPLSPHSRPFLLRFDELHCADSNPPRLRFLYTRASAFPKSGPHKPSHPPCRTIQDSSTTAATTAAITARRHRNNSNMARLRNKDTRHSSMAPREYTMWDAVARANADAKQTTTARLRIPALSEPATTVQQQQQQLWRTIRPADSSTSTVRLQPGV